MTLGGDEEASGPGHVVGLVLLVLVEAGARGEGRAPAPPRPVRPA